MNKTNEDKRKEILTAFEHRHATKAFDSTKKFQQKIGKPF